MGTVRFQVVRKFQHGGKLAGFHHIGVLMCQNQRSGERFLSDVFQGAVLLIDHDGLFIPDERLISNRLYPNVDNPEQVSDWERLFYAALFDNGIQTIPQYPFERLKMPKNPL